MGEVYSFLFVCLRKDGCKTEDYFLFNSKNAIYSLIKGMIIDSLPRRYLSDALSTLFGCLIA